MKSDNRTLLKNLTCHWMSVREEDIFIKNWIIFCRSLLFLIPFEFESEIENKSFVF